MYPEASCSTESVALPGQSAAGILCGDQVDDREDEEMEVVDRRASEQGPQARRLRPYGLASALRELLFPDAPQAS